MPRLFKRPGTKRTLGQSWSLAWRLLLPLVVAAVVFCGAVTVFLIRGVSVRMDREVDARLDELADSLISSSLALDQELLSRVRAVTKVEVTTLSSEGIILASTLSEENAQELGVRLQEASVGEPISLEGENYRLAKRPVTTSDQPEGTILVVAASTRPMDRLKHEVAWTIIIATGLQIVLLVGTGHVVFSTATRHLARLARTAREVGRGALDRRVPGGGGREIDMLAKEFNLMVSELARSRQELVRAERSAVAGRITASVAHEIRNPLSSIRMNIQLLIRRSRSREDFRRELQDVLDEVDRLDLVLGNLLDLTAASRFTPTLTSLGSIVEDTLRLTSRKLEHLNVVVETDLGEDLPEIHLDHHKARQAFLNVILNAADAMPGGGILRVSVRRLGHFVELCFEDTGSGITPEVASRVFEPFFSTKPGGAGLGLHIVRHIVELHGARIRLEPSVPRGTRCVMEFPIAAEAVRAVAPAAGRGPA